MLNLIEYLINVFVKKPVQAPPTPVQPAPIQAPSTPALLWDTPQNSRHSVRVVCDDRGLSLTKTFLASNGKYYVPKDVICAVIEGESQFYNYLSGKPLKKINYEKDGKTVSSTDWGICQINDYYHIGTGKDFPSVDYLMAHPQEAVAFMVDMMKAGRLTLWVAYLNGSYEKYLPQN